MAPVTLNSLLFPGAVCSEDLEDWLCDKGPGEPQPDGRPFDIAQADPANRGDEHLDHRDILPDVGYGRHPFNYHTRRTDYRDDTRTRRKFEDLLTLTPGVSISQGPDGDEININGQRGIFNNISLDGGDYDNGFFGEQSGGQRAAVDITLEAIKEFQIVASGANAEFGRTGGGVVNVNTKSGTNDFHGSTGRLLQYQ
jgi:hypothetical protein